MVVMSAILTTLLGGLLAIAGALVGIALTDRRERNRWLRDSQLQASTDLISALQLVIRRMINIAYLDPVKSGNYELKNFKRRKPRNPHSLGVIASFDDAMIEWNNARYKALVIVPTEVAATIPELDKEVDRILALAHSRAWTRAEFRQERITIGRMAANYLKLARALAGMPGLELNSIWTWDTGNVISRTERRSLQ
jgi:hypothetical protein